MRTGLYFGAGPAALPTDVVEHAAREFVEYEDQGVGLGEMSHRNAKATDIVNDAKSNIKQYLDIPDTHEVLFLQGGGTGGFATCLYAMGAYIYAKEQRPVVGDYLVTGSWSSKAVGEAKRLGFESNTVGKPSSFIEVPKYEEPAKRGDFLYYCDNETVNGVEFPGKTTAPGADVESKYDLFITDISSNMMSRPIDVSKFAIVFGGAQKNVGIPGVTLYIVRKDILETLSSVKPADLLKAGIPVAPSFLDLSLAAANNSAYNTVSIFAIEVIKLVTARALKRGGLPAQAEETEKKAKLLYSALDSRQDKFDLVVKPEFRSRMNIVFTVKGDDPAEAEKKFLADTAKQNISGVKGHRSVGGIRVSNYNAISYEAIEKVTNVVKSFQ